MTIREQHFDFKVKIDEVDSLTNKGFTDAEIDWLLNEAELVVVRTRLNLNNFRQKGFEMDQKRIEDLSTLVVRPPEEGDLSLDYHSDLNIYEFNFNDLKHKYLMYLRGTVEVVSDNCSSRAEVVQVQTDDIHDALEDPFFTSSGKQVLSNIGRSTTSIGTGSSLFFYPAVGDLLSNLRIEYLKYPRRVNLGTYTYIDGVQYPETNSELPEHLHSEVVDQAVLMATAFIQNPNLYQTSALKVQGQE